MRTFVEAEKAGRATSIVALARGEKSAMAGNGVHSCHSDALHHDFDAANQNGGLLSKKVGVKLASARSKLVPQA